MRNVVFFLLYLLCNPRLIGLVFKNIYLPVYVQFEWLRKYNIQTIIDIGANCGHVTKTLYYLFPKATIYAFEPIKSESDKICKSENIIVENIALSNKSGTATLYKNNYSPASSLLSITPSYARKNKILSVFKKITVKSTTLDSYFKNIKLSGIVFLKIDTQGTEKLILEGGRNLLKKVSIIHVETPFVELYKNQGFFEDIYDYLIKLGFRYMGNVNEANFYPIFGTSEVTNSVFLKPSIDTHE